MGRLITLLLVVSCLVGLTMVGVHADDPTSRAKAAVAKLINGERIKFSQTTVGSRGVTEDGNALIDELVRQFAPKALGGSLGAQNAPEKLKARLKTIFARSSDLETDGCSGNDEAVAFAVTFLSLPRNFVSKDNQGKEISAERTLLVESETRIGNVELLRAYAREECAVSLWEGDTTGLVFNPINQKSDFRIIFSSGWDGNGASDVSRKVGKIDFADLEVGQLFVVPYRVGYTTPTHTLDVVITGPADSISPALDNQFQLLQRHTLRLANSVAN